MQATCDYLLSHLSDYRGKKRSRYRTFLQRTQCHNKIYPVWEAGVGNSSLTTLPASDSSHRPVPTPLHSGTAVFCSEKTGLVRWRAFPWGLNSFSHTSRCLGYNSCCASAGHQLRVTRATMCSSISTSLCIWFWYVECAKAWGTGQGCFLPGLMAALVFFLLAIHMAWLYFQHFWAIQLC